VCVCAVRLFVCLEGLLFQCLSRFFQDKTYLRVSSFDIGLTDKTDLANKVAIFQQLQDYLFEFFTVEFKDDDRNESDSVRSIMCGRAVSVARYSDGTNRNPDTKPHSISLNILFK
jgi:hypothetical protein